MRLSTTLLLACSTIAALCQAQPAQLPQLGTQSIKQVIAAMTRDEKVWMVLGTEAVLKKPKSDIAADNGIIGATEHKVPGAAGTSFAIARLGIPSIVMADGPAGVRISPTRPNRPGVTFHATAFPVGTLLASTWDSAMVDKVGRAFGKEVLEYGVDIILAPGNNIQRNPLNGRNFEYYSEDPLVGGTIAAAMINGLQSNGIGTSLKHYAANNQETRRLSVNAEISERALREIYLKTFQIALQQSSPWTVMSSYNKLNGTYAVERQDLITGVLRNEWKYDGMVVSDWGAGKNVIEQVRAGHSLIMPGRYDQFEALSWAMNNGKLDEAVFDQRIEDFLKLVLKTPTFRRYAHSDKPDLAAHAAVAREAASAGMVLLKNDPGTLPLATSVRRIAAFGNSSYRLSAGGTGSGMVNMAYVVGLDQGLKAAGYRLEDSLANAYVAHMDRVAAGREKPKNPAAGRPQIPELEVADDTIAVQAASADVAVVTIGKNAGEGADRNLDNNYHLMPGEISLLKRVSEAFHRHGKKMVVVLNVGGVIDLASWQHHADAIVLAWQPGQEGGHAITDILSGKVNPSGKLAITFPQKYADVPSAKFFPGTPLEKPETVVYEEGIYTGYRYYDTYRVKPAHEFGFGLSYTRFSLGRLVFGAPRFGQSLSASMVVTNTGSVPGREVVQIYVSAPDDGIDKPVQELRAFVKTRLLRPGESERLRFTLRAGDLASYYPAKAAWVAQAGTYTLRAGVSSRDIRQSKSFRVARTLVTAQVSRQVLPSQPIITEFTGK